jgi:hypothetical protein
MLDELTEQVQIPILNHMQRSAAKHAARSDGLLIALPVNIDAYPHESLTDLTERHTDELATTSSLLPIASLIRPNFSKLTNSIIAADTPTPDGMPGSVTKTKDALGEKKNVVWAYDHGEDVLTFMFTAAAGTNVLRDMGTVSRSGYIGSKMMDFLAIDLQSFGEYKKKAEELLEAAQVPIEADGLVYARKILARVFQHQYFTIPNTQTTAEFRKEHEIAIKLITRYILSTVTTDQLKSRLHGNSALHLHVAFPGALNKPLDLAEYQHRKTSEHYDFDCSVDPNGFTADSAIEVVGGASEGMIKFLRHATTWAVVAKMLGTTPFFGMSSNGIEIKDAGDIRTIGKQQISLLDAHEPNVIHIYDHAKSLPVVEPTA